MKAYTLTYVTLHFLFLLLPFRSIYFFSRDLFLEYVGSTCLNMKIGFQTPTKCFSLHYVIRNNQVEKFVLLLQKKTHLIIPIPIRHKKIETIIPIALAKTYLLIPSRHKKIKTTIPIRIGQVCVPIPRRCKKKKRTISITLG
jgi:hypothetical protein